MHIVNNVDKRVFGSSDDLETDWPIIESSTKQKELLVFDVKDSTSLVEFKIACGNIGFNWVVLRTFICRLGNHLRMIMRNKLAKFFTREYLFQFVDERV